MRVDIPIEVIHDHSYGDKVYQTTSESTTEGHKCDACEQIIPEGRSLHTGDEDFCISCFHTGRVVSFYRKQSLEDKDIITILGELYDQIA